MAGAELRLASVLAGWSERGSRRVRPTDGTADIWIYDTSRGAPVRFTTDPADQSGPVWSPEGSRILFRTVRGGPESLRMGSAAPNLHAKAVATGIEEPLVSDPSPLAPEDWSPRRPMDRLHQEHADKRAGTSG